MRTPEATNILFNVLAQRYRDRDGGYTRILRTRKRDNDRAHMAFIECVPLSLSTAFLLSHFHPSFSLPKLPIFWIMNQQEVISESSHCICGRNCIEVLDVSAEFNPCVHLVTS